MMMVMMRFDQLRCRQVVYTAKICMIDAFEVKQFTAHKKRKRTPSEIRKLSFRNSSRFSFPIKFEQTMNN